VSVLPIGAVNTLKRPRQIHTDYDRYSPSYASEVPEQIHFEPPLNFRQTGKDVTDAERVSLLAKAGGHTPADHISASLVPPHLTLSPHYRPLQRLPRRTPPHRPALFGVVLSISHKPLGIHPSSRAPYTIAEPQDHQRSQAGSIHLAS